MQKSTHAPHYEAVRLKLIAMRTEAGLTHRQLASLLGREHSFVWRIEQGERRLDVVEFHWVCRALGRASAEVYRDLSKGFERLDPRPISSFRNNVLKSVFGRGVMSFLRAEERMNAMIFATKSGKPALSAVLEEIEAKFGADLIRTAHKQFVGEAIRFLLEERGYEVTGKNRKVRGRFFNKAAIFMLRIRGNN